MSTNTERAPFETPAERAAQRTDLDTQGKRGGPEDSMTVRRLSVEAIGLAAAVVATIVTYGFFIVHPQQTGAEDKLKMTHWMKYLAGYSAGTPPDKSALDF